MHLFGRLGNAADGRGRHDVLQCLGLISMSLSFIKSFELSISIFLFFRRLDFFETAAKITF